MPVFSDHMAKDVNKRRGLPEEGGGDAGTAHWDKMRRVGEWGLRRGQFYLQDLLSVAQIGCGLVLCCLPF